MSFPEFVDLRIATETANMQLNESQREVLNRISEIYEERTKDLELDPIELLKVFQEVLLENEGASEAFALEGALTLFNLQTLRENLKI